MTTEAAEPKPIETMLGLSIDWKPPAKWADWTFEDFVGCPDLDAWLAKAPQVEKLCARCGDKETCNALNAAAFPNAACDKCCDEYGRREQEPEKVRLLEEKLAALIPPLYSDTILERLKEETTAKQIAEALAFEKSATAHGIVLVGDTRTGKSRTLCLLLEKLLREGHSIRAFFHGSFSDDLVEVMRSERSYRSWKKEVAEAELLAIDDLFSEKLTERCEAALFEVLDERICHYRPTFITTQITKKEGMKRFHSTKRAEAFFARLREFFTIILCGKREKQEELDIA